MNKMIRECKKKKINGSIPVVTAIAEKKVVFFIVDNAMLIMLCFFRGGWSLIYE